MTGDLNLGGKSINNIKDLKATGSIGNQKCNIITITCVRETQQCLVMILRL